MVSIITLATLTILIIVFHTAKSLLPVNFKFDFLISLVFLTLLFLLFHEIKFPNIGLTTTNLYKSIFVGVIIGLVVILIFGTIAFLTKDLFNIRDPRLTNLSTGLVIYLIFTNILFGNGFFEEIVYRGILFSEFSKLVTTIIAILISSFIFVIPHAISTYVIYWPSITATLSSRMLQYFAFFGILTIVFLGGLLLSYIRISTGNLAGSIVAHWIINSGALAIFYILTKI